MKKIYEKMVNDKISFRKMVEEIEPKITAQGLYSQMRKFCEKNDLKMPTVKRGKKAISLNLKNRYEKHNFT